MKYNVNMNNAESSINKNYDASILCDRWNVVIINKGNLREIEAV